MPSELSPGPGTMHLAVCSVVLWVPVCLSCVLCAPPSLRVCEGGILIWYRRYTPVLKIDSVGS